MISIPSEHIGVWWNPQKPDQKVPGMMTVRKSHEVEVKLIGSLEGDGVPALFSKRRRYPILHGSLRNGSNITLLEVRRLRSGGSHTVTTTQLESRFCVVGAHLPDQDLCLSSLRLDIDRLHSWVGKSSIEKDNMWPLGPSASIKWNALDSVELHRSEKLIAAIQFYVSVEGAADGEQSVGFREATELMLMFQKPLNFDGVWDTLTKFRNFLTLAMGEPAHISSVRTSIGHLHDVQLIFPIESPERDSERSFPPFLLPFQSFERVALGVLSNWISKYDLLQPICDVYFGSLYNPRLYVQYRFLAVMQALEAYHRRFVRNEELPESEARKRLNDIVKTCPVEHRKWLCAKLNFSNEPSLRVRLKELVNRFSPLMGHYVPDFDKFIRSACDNRNYLAHFNQRLKKAELRGSALGALTAKLGILLQACLLNELGFAPDDVFRLITEYPPNFRHVVLPPEAVPPG